jgi:hypothetical protein
MQQNDENIPDDNTAEIRGANSLHPKREELSDIEPGQVKRKDTGSPTASEGGKAEFSKKVAGKERESDDEQQ